MNKYLEKIAGIRFPRLSTIKPFSSTPKVVTPSGPMKLFGAKPIGKAPTPNMPSPKV